MGEDRGGVGSSEGRVYKCTGMKRRALLGGACEAN